MSCSIEPNIEGVPHSALAAALEQHKDNLKNGKSDSNLSHKHVEGFLNKTEWSDVLKNLANSENPDMAKAIVEAGKPTRDHLHNEVNTWIEEKRGIASDKVITEADIQHEDIKKYRHILRSSANDIEGLAYAFFGKGTRGEEQQKLFEEQILNPYWEGKAGLNADYVNSKDYIGDVLSKHPEVAKRLKKKIGHRKFSTEQAIRVYNFVKSGQIAALERQGISRADVMALVGAVENDSSLKNFATDLSDVFGNNDYVKVPGRWAQAGIARDVSDHVKKVRGKEHLKKFARNADAMFSPDNLAKIEVAYGKNRRKAIEDAINGMKGVGKATDDSLSAKVGREFVDFVNTSVTTTLFFNRRSAGLQSLSVVNFLNWDYNNIAVAGKARLNHKQYKADKKLFMEGHFIRHRKEYNSLDINLRDINDIIERDDPDGTALWHHLKKKRAQLGNKGLVLTRMMDAWAISSGGAIHYRNRINNLTKGGTDLAVAEEQSMRETLAIARKSQQSSDRALTSAEQNSSLGTIILAYANTPMQYTRIAVKAAEDLINGRGSTKSNVSKMIYYGAAANIMFTYVGKATNYALGLLIGEDDGEEDDEYVSVDDQIKEEILEIEKISSMLVNSYRGFGYAGAIFGMAQTFGLEATLQIFGKKDRDIGRLAVAFASISPPLQSKLRSSIKLVDYFIADNTFKPTLLDKPHALSKEVRAIAEGLKVLDVPAYLLTNTVEEVNAIIYHNLELSQQIGVGLGFSNQEFDIPFKFDWDDLDEVGPGQEDRLDDIYDVRLEEYFKRREEEEEAREKYYD